MLYYIVLHNTKLHSIITKLHYMVVGHVMLYAILLGCSILYVTMLYYSMLYTVILSYSIVDHVISFNIRSYYSVFDGIVMSICITIYNVM